MLPEISRRCLSCGAAVRAGSRFCPQCGKGLEAEDAPPLTEERAPDAARARVPTTGDLEPPSAEEWAPPTQEFKAFESPPVVAEPQAASAEPLPVAAAPANVEVGPEASFVSAPEPHAETLPAPEEAERAGDRRGRVARVREETRARVGRMREEAIVVLEETPDDSGLRFVLAAAALFILFLVLLFLSTTVLR